MKRGWALHVVGVLSIVGGFGCGRAPLAKLTPGRENVRQIPTAEYVDRMKAGWIDHTKKCSKLSATDPRISQY